MVVLELVCKRVDISSGVLCCCLCHVQAIRAAADGPAAKAALVSRFRLSEAQAEGVLAMTLRCERRVCVGLCVWEAAGGMNVQDRCAWKAVCVALRYARV